MSEPLSDWIRPHYRGPGGKPFLFYVLPGAFSEGPAISANHYRTQGVPAELTLSKYDRVHAPEVLSRFQAGFVWEELVAGKPDLARRISDADECLILRGELDDCGDLNYLRDSVGILTYFLDHGGVSVYDPQILRWWEPEAWRRDVFEPGKPVPRHHVVILFSDEEERTPGGERLAWFHTRGMRKFGRPDLSVRDVSDDHQEAVIDLLNRFIEFQAFGGVIAEGQEIRMQGLPMGMTCHHRGAPEDPDFNNVHVEIVSP